jgi:hypothetical protein
MELTMGRIGLHQVDGATLCNSGAVRRRGVSGRTRDRVLWSVAAALAALCGCSGNASTDTSTSASDAPAASATLKSLDAKQLTGLCGQLLPKIRASSTPTHDCTLRAYIASNDETSCAAAKQTCVTDKTYDDWSKAACADFAGDAGTAPKFDCTTKVSEVTACFDASAKWLNALTCKAADPADTTPAPPTCLDDLLNGPCKFDIDLFLKDTNFKANNGTGTVPSGFFCIDGNKKYEYDLGSGDACNVCATSAKSTCCDSWVTCLKNTACECYVNCVDTDDVCFKQCNITDLPPDFVTHANCVGDNCSQECGF